MPRRCCMVQIAWASAYIIETGTGEGHWGTWLSRQCPQFTCYYQDAHCKLQLHTGKQGMKYGTTVPTDRDLPSNGSSENFVFWANVPTFLIITLSCAIYSSTAMFLSRPGIGSYHIWLNKRPGIYFLKRGLDPINVKKKKIKKLGRQLDSNQGSSAFHWHKLTVWAVSAILNNARTNLVL